MCEYETSNHINGVMSTHTDHQYELDNHGEDSVPEHASEPICVPFESGDESSTYMTRKEEIIAGMVRNDETREPRIAPCIAVGVS